MFEQRGYAVFCYWLEDGVLLDSDTHSFRSILLLFSGVHRVRFYYKVLVYIVMDNKMSKIYS